MVAWLVVWSCATRSGPPQGENLVRLDLPAPVGGGLTEPDSLATLAGSPAPPPAAASPAAASRPAATPSLRAPGRGPHVEAPAPLAAATEPAFLVWSEQKGEVATYWLTSSAAGYAVAQQRPGRWLAVGQTEWQLTNRATRTQLPSCDELLGDSRPARARFASTQELTAEAGSSRHVLYTAPRDVAPVDSTIERISVVGPYLFAEAHERIEQCGAFTQEIRSLRTWDLRTWQSVDLGADRRAVHEELLADARSAIGDDCEGLLHLGIGAFRPNFDGPRLLGEYAVTMTPACDPYPEWTHESSHVIVRSPDLPAPITDYAEVPAVVRGFLAAHPDATPHGWTQAL